MHGSPPARNTSTSGAILPARSGIHGRATQAADSNGDGIGDTPYTINGFPVSLGETAIVDRAPLVSGPESYTLVRSAGLVNITGMDQLVKLPETSAAGTAEYPATPGGSGSPGRIR